MPNGAERPVGEADSKRRVQRCASITTTIRDDDWRVRSVRHRVHASCTARSRHRRPREFYSCVFIGGVRRRRPARPHCAYSSRRPLDPGDLSRRVDAEDGRQAKLILEGHCCVLAAEPSSG